MRSLHLFLVALAMTAPAYTQTTPPTAPSVTAGAEFKGLRFDWDSVPGVSWYQLEYRAHQTSAFVQQGASLSAATTNVRLRLPLHLFNWTYARYRVAACNSAGCARSNEVSVSDLRRYAVGYFKPGLSIAGFRFGADTDLSPDGLNFVVAAPGEYQYGENGYAFNSGSIYVFRRAATNGTWTQRARLFPPIPPFIGGTNEVRVAISADGNTVVMGMPLFWKTQLDLQGGEVYVFRAEGAGWTRTRLQSGDRGLFGRWVSINDAGDTITTPYGDPENPNQPHRTVVYKFVNGAWRPVRAIADRASHPEYCYEGVMSRDGSTIAETCDAQRPGIAEIVTYVRVHSGPNWTVREDVTLTSDARSDFGYGHHGIGIDGAGHTIAAQINVLHGPHEDTGPSRVQVFSKAGGAWTNVINLAPGAWRDTYAQGTFGRSLEFSGDGSTLAIGDGSDNGWGTGPRAAPLNPDPAHRTGAYYIYRLKNNAWVLANMVKANIAEPFTSTFGRAASLNGNGQTLVVGHAEEDGDDSGIGGRWDLHSEFSTDSGAVFLY